MSETKKKLVTMDGNEAGAIVFHPFGKIQNVDVSLVPA